ncbi:MAG TPA: hypothetical protein VME01_09855 [Solirubrobacteraceae bacterium]|nr:hypothetical protein [Solirubrobacteraceae bacterium]
MRERIRRGALLGAFLLVAAGAFAPAASASTTPSLTLDQSAGNTAGSTANLGMDLKFANSSGDSPDQLVINLPPGLLANASIDDGACLTTTDLSDTNCQVGTGTVTADALDLVPLPTAVTFDLVPPPAAGDLAGLAVNDDGTQIGDTADVKVRPSGSPGGVGITIDFTLPNTLDGVPIQIAEIDSTFDGLRYPTTCPSTPANLSVSVNSYDDSTMQNAAAPLSVSGCSSLPYAPKFSVSVVKDKSDRSVKLTTNVTQAATEAPNGSLSLSFGGNALGVNIGAIKALCTNVASGTCTPVGTATATSPLYPRTLTANAYLTGTALGPSLTLVFPAPFPLTLVGNVDLLHDAATFTGLPDIPLTSLSLALNGGSTGMFLTNCNPASGSVTAQMTDQNGDKKVSATDAYSISGCPGASSTTKNGTLGGGKSGSGTSGSGKSAGGSVTISKPAVSGLKTGHPVISFALVSHGAAGRLTTVTVDAPRGLSFVTSRVHGHLRISGVSVSGARVKSLAIVRGNLVIRLRGNGATRIHVTISGALRESRSMRAPLLAHKATSVKLTVVGQNGARHRYTARSVVRA